uniref:Uncharacterized protein n=1 Tax=Angiostrongylus cantonensis TaxID=6313 RepID=A0A158P8X3_ANGCA
MGAEQSVDNKDQPLAKENEQSVQSSFSGKMAGSGSTTGEKLDTKTNREFNQVTNNNQMVKKKLSMSAKNKQKSFKRCNRSKADPWRRYGALRKLHEIGGTGCIPSNQISSHGPQKFYRIEAGSVPPPPPSIPPITTVEEYGTLEELITPKRKKGKARKSENSHC